MLVSFGIDGIFSFSSRVVGKVAAEDIRSWWREVGLHMWFVRWGRATLDSRRLIVQLKFEMIEVGSACHGIFIFELWRQMP
jgi:hypothetical protein